ncbi:MAG TPA: hypothetical protein PK957_01505 [Candidatus Dojkabacteria bacterium]|nr:hypothetical protein [Candidatus Dojkabacteria bacterium]HQF36351.1 hypothetical protein [Candidatus Dojkabacteria bacterium]
MKNKTIVTIVSVILLLSICTGSIVIIINKTKQAKNNNDQNTEESKQDDNSNNSDNNQDDTYVPPEEKPTEEKEHNLTLKIISPEEEIFSVRQARHYNALAEGNAKYSHLVRCHWDFYLDQNNGEALYQTMDNTGVLSGESKEMCGFTSTFIEATGNLRVVLTMTVYDAVNDNLETVTAEKKYIVR